MTNYNGTHHGCVALNSLDWAILEDIYNLSNPTIDVILEPFDEFPEDYYDGVTATIDGVTFEITLIGGAYHLLISDSPFTTDCRRCSPMLPNMGDLDSEDPLGIKTYSPPPTWFYTKESQA